MRNVTVLTILLGVAVMTLGGARPSPDAAAGGGSVTITESGYSPATVTIKAGESVTWVNRDSRDHTAIARDNSFDSGNIRSGESFTSTFKKPGRYPYGCRYHPRMAGMIVVTE